MSSVSFFGALAFAVSGGITTFFAPCAFPLLPGYIGYYLSQTDSDRPGAVVLPAFAAAGSALVVLAVIGAVGFALGQIVLTRLPLLEPLVGAGIFVLGGLMLADLTPEMHIPLPERSGSTLGFSLFGAGYAGAAAGCVVPVLFGVLAQALAFPPTQAAVIFGAYALSVSLPLIGVTLLAATGSDTWRNLGTYTNQLRKVAAILMMIAGLGQLYLSIVVLDVLELPMIF